MNIATNYASEAYLRFRKGGHANRKLIRQVLTKEGHEHFRLLTTRQRTWFRELCHQHVRNGAVKVTLKLGQQRSPIDALLEWGMIVGEWHGVTFKGHVADGMLREQPKVAPTDLADRTEDVSEKLPEVSDTPKFTEPTTPYGIPVSMATTISVMSCVIGAIFGSLLTLAISAH